MRYGKQEDHGYAATGPSHGHPAPSERRNVVVGIGIYPARGWCGLGCRRRLGSHAGARTVADWRGYDGRGASLGRSDSWCQQQHSCCMSPGLTLDAGGLIAVDRGQREIAVLLARAAERKARITVPATAL